MPGAIGPIAPGGAGTLPLRWLFPYFAAVNDDSGRDCQTHVAILNLASRSVAFEVDFLQANTGNSAVLVSRTVQSGRNGHRQGGRWTYGIVSETAPENGQSSKSGTWSTYTYMKRAGLVYDHCPEMLPDIAAGKQSLDGAVQAAKAVRRREEQRESLPDDLGGPVDSGAERTDADLPVFGGLPLRSLRQAAFLRWTQSWEQGKVQDVARSLPERCPDRDRRRAVGHRVGPARRSSSGNRCRVRRGAFHDSTPAGNVAAAPAVANPVRRACQHLDRRCGGLRNGDFRGRLRT